MKRLSLSLATGTALAATAIMAQPNAPTYKVHCRAGAQESWTYNEFPEGTWRRIRASGRDRLYLDGLRISRATLLQRLERIGAEPRPNFTLLVYTDTTSCALVQEIRVAMTRALRCEQGRCGEHYTTDRPPPPPTREEFERAVAQADADIQNAVNAAMEAANAQAGPEPPMSR